MDVMGHCVLAKIPNWRQLKCKTIVGELISMEMTFAFVLIWLLSLVSIILSFWIEFFFCLLRSIFVGFFSKNTPNENQFYAQNFEENNMQSRKLMTMCKKQKQKWSILQIYNPPQNKPSTRIRYTCHFGVFLAQGTKKVWFGPDLKLFFYRKNMVWNLVLGYKLFNLTLVLANNHTEKKWGKYFIIQY
jgi:hypothetical protein